MITLDKQIVEKVECEMSKLNIHNTLDDTLLELKYRERQGAQVKQLEKAIKSLEQQVEQVKAAILRYTEKKPCSFLSLIFLHFCVQRKTSSCGM